MEEENEKEDIQMDISNLSQDIKNVGKTFSS